MSTAFFEHVAADPIVSKEFTDEQLRHFFSELEAPVSYPEEFLRHIDDAGFDSVGDFLVHYALGDLDTVEDLDDFLAHYGIMGMKWGVRNAESSRRTGKPKSNKPRVSSKSSDKKSSKSNRLSDNPKNRRMTDAELKATVARLRLERELSDLRPRELASNNRVREMLKDVAFDVVKGASTEAGKAILTHVLTTQYTKHAKGDFKLPQQKKK